MKKLNLLKTLILVITVLTGTVEAFATATEVRTLTVSAQEAVTIEKLANCNESNTIDAATGIHTGLNASFLLQVNDINTEDVFIVGSKITAQGGEIVSAFSNDGTALLFGRYNEEEHFPTLDAIENAKAGGSNNANVIAYPISKMTITAPMTMVYNASIVTEEGTVGGYVINLNESTTATIEQIIGGSPYGETYSGGQDMAGDYKSTVFFTIAKP